MALGNSSSPLVRLVHRDKGEGTPALSYPPSSLARHPGGPLSWAATYRRAPPGGVLFPAFTLGNSYAKPAHAAGGRHGLGVEASLSVDGPKEEQGDTVSKTHVRQFCKK